MFESRSFSCWFAKSFWINNLNIKVGKIHPIRHFKSVIVNVHVYNRVEQVRNPTNIWFSFYNYGHCIRIYSCEFLYIERSWMYYSIINRLLDISDFKKLNMGLDRLSIFMYLLDTKNKYYKNLKKGSHQSHLGRQKMGWFLAD